MSKSHLKESRIVHAKDRFLNGCLLASGHLGKLDLQEDLAAIFALLWLEVSLLQHELCVERTVLERIILGVQHWSGHLFSTSHLLFVEIESQFEQVLDSIKWIPVTVHLLLHPPKVFGHLDLEPFPDSFVLHPLQSPDHSLDASDFFQKLILHSLQGLFGQNQWLGPSLGLGRERAGRVQPFEDLVETWVGRFQLVADPKMDVRLRQRSPSPPQHWKGTNGLKIEPQEKGISSKSNPNSSFRLLGKCSQKAYQFCVGKLRKTKRVLLDRPFQTPFCYSRCQPGVNQTGFVWFQDDPNLWRIQMISIPHLWALTTAGSIVVQIVTYCVTLH